MRRVLFDTNAVDPLTDAHTYDVTRQAVEAGSLEVLYTHVTIDELAEIPDVDRRQQLLVLLVSIGRIVPTGSTVVDYSRVEFCRVSSDESEAPFEALRSNNLRHTKDALIADTAVFEGCALVTNERRLTNRARARGIEVLTSAELVAQLVSRDCKRPQGGAVN
ncbi:hypothetical protein [Streptomyces tendae]|uniref:hypothetical protein n=1 Tax=Streptomyces tendae TaxID=1932 RepID=UPI00364DF384